MDMVVHCGDLADYSFVEAYKNYNQVWKDIFGKTNVLRRFCYANHDDLIYGGGQGKLHVMKEIFNENKDYVDLKFKGYHFLIVPQKVNIERYEAMVNAAVADTSPDKPVFVFDHVPAANTVYGSEFWGNPATRQILNKYPNVIQVSCHIHNTLRNELCIWQDEFTVVDVGCMQVWYGDLVGTATEKNELLGLL